MTKRIEEDHKAFRDVYSGKIRKELQKYINNGTIFRFRGNKGINITIPRIDIPHITFGEPNEGIHRGEGNEGDVIGYENNKGKGKGKGQAGDTEGEGITINIDLEEVLKFMKNELRLPDLKPKSAETFEDIKIKYNDISLVGPESLRHNRRTMLQAMKRMAASGSLDELKQLPGFSYPIKMIKPINSDKRYRQYKEIRIPSNNAVIFFARDGSASMDQYKCDIISDMCWWIDVWIRKFYKKVERNYIWHDTAAQEVPENKFYNYRYGGGTICSSALKLISKLMENKYPPAKWNIYVFYFTDGENFGNDNETFCKIIKEQFPPNVVNFVGITQVLSYMKNESLKKYIDTELNVKNLKTTEISFPQGQGYNPDSPLSDEERDKQIRESILDLLGDKVQK